MKVKKSNIVQYRLDATNVKHIIAWWATQHFGSTVLASDISLICWPHEDSVSFNEAVVKLEKAETIEV